MTNEAVGLIVDSCSSLRMLKIFGCGQVMTLVKCCRKFLYNCHPMMKFYGSFSPSGNAVAGPWSSKFNSTFLADHKRVPRWSLESRIRNHWFEDVSSTGTYSATGFTRISIAIFLSVFFVE